MQLLLIIFGIAAVYAYFKTKKSEEPLPIIILIFGIVLAGSGVLLFF